MGNPVSARLLGTGGENLLDCLDSTFTGSELPSWSKLSYLRDAPSNGSAKLDAYSSYRRELDRVLRDETRRRMEISRTA
jgi:hypothetical protein